ncbi:MAG TPA: pitrilysin family protein [Polyangia bacterium]
MTTSNRLAFTALATVVSLALPAPGCAAASVPPPATRAPAAAQARSPSSAATQVALGPPAQAAKAPPPATTPDAPFRAEAPAPGPEPAFRVPAFKRFKLKNGAEVILAEFHDLPLVEVHLVVKTGGAANPPGEAGLADLTANMLDEGTNTRSALQIAEQTSALGAALSTASSWDGSSVTLSAIARNFEPALAIWADVITHPAFSEKELSRVRDNLLTAVTRRKDSPPTLANLLLARVLFGDKHPYAWPLTGVEETLKKISTADLRSFYSSYYRPSNATIIAAGDITEAELRSRLEAALRDWKPARATAPKVATPSAPTGRRIYLIDKPDAPQSSIRVGFLGVRRTDPDYFPILLMNQILGGAFYRLDMNLRERQQWTYGARSSFEMRRTPGLASAGGEFVAPHTADAVAEILKEMRVIATSEVTDEEMTRAKENFVRAFPARFATRASTAALLGELALYGLPDSFLTDYVKNIQAVTKADVLRVAQRFLSTDRMAIVVVGDRATQETPLRKLAPLEIRDLDGAPVAATPTARDVGPRPGASN